jgi:hypothetical protein
VSMNFPCPSAFTLAILSKLLNDVGFQKLHRGKK